MVPNHVPKTAACHFSPAGADKKNPAVMMILFLPNNHSGIIGDIEIQAVYLFQSSPLKH